MTTGRLNFCLNFFVLMIQTCTIEVDSSSRVDNGWQVIFLKPGKREQAELPCQAIGTDLEQAGLTARRYVLKY